jgi:predicted alpha/beta-hydrolase family hydrolase
MPEDTVTVSVDQDRAVTAVRTPRHGKAAGWMLLYAPGAGSNVHDPFGRYLSKRVAERGIDSARIQFPYMEAGRRRPDPPSLLEATWRAAIETFRPPRGRLVIGGRSMGGRIASMVVADGMQVDALALFAYPLHPPGRPRSRRDEHLPLIAVPAFLCSGSRDAFALPEELREAAALVPHARVHILEEADHGLAVRKSSGRSREDVWQEAADAMLEWLKGL